MIEKSELGIVKISGGAIAGIAARAAMEVKGVTGVGGGFLHAFLKVLRIGSRHGIKVDILSSGDVMLVVPVSIEYGREISAVSAEVQERVKKSIEELSGLEVIKIDVVIDGVQ